ncbi:MAG: M3 family metallopeptidase [Planctomycetaceae bacterium]
MPRHQFLAACTLLTLTGIVFAMPSTPAAANPLLEPWPGPYGGVPPFDRVQVADFEPALEAAMAEQIAVVERIAGGMEPPTFNAVVAEFERSSRLLDRVLAVFGVYGGNLSTDAIREVERRMAPRLAAHQDRIVQHRQFFDRVAAVHETAAAAGLTPEQERAAWLLVTSLARAGARLDASRQAELATLNEQLAELFTIFSQNVLAEEDGSAVFLDTEDDLAGMSESARQTAAAAAASRGRPGVWAIPNTRSAVEPVLAFADRRAVREQVWRMFVGRGGRGGAADNREIVPRILTLRARRARLLGFATHAHWRLEDSMAETPDRAIGLMEAVWKPAVARVHEEVADMQAIVDADHAGITIAPWDYRYYAEKVRRARYDLDEAEVTPYLQLDRLRDGMFFVAEKLFGLSFVAVGADAVPVFHPDVNVWEVRRGAEVIGLWYFDPYARTGKRSGAWMSDYRVQERLDAPVVAIVSNNCNFAKPPAGEPALLSWDDATTLFHEFGHSLHGLLSDVTHPSLSGTRVTRDYVELPSQILEHWLSTPEVLGRSAIHCDTGEPIPADLVARIRRAETFNSGFRTVEFLASAIVDMRLHLAGSEPVDPERFERETLEALGMPREIVMRHRIPHFLHIFADDGYSAGYYSYLWADTLTADAWEAFTEAGGPWDAGVAERLRRHVLSAGNTVDPDEGYRSFRGRDATIDALMRKRGFAAPR